MVRFAVSKALVALVALAIALSLACQPAPAPTPTPAPPKPAAPAPAPTAAPAKPAAPAPAAPTPAPKPPAAAPTAAPKPAAPARPDQILVALDWIILGQHSPFFVALEKGFYAEQNLAATVSRGYGSGDTAKRVASKQATFGFADSGSMLAGRANDDLKVKLVAAIYGDAAPSVIYNPNRGISKPKDLEGKSMVDSAASAGRLLFPAFAKANGVDNSKIKWSIVEPSAVTSLFVSGKLDAVPLFVLEVPVVKNLVKDSKDVEVGYWRYADYGVKMYGNGLLAHEDTIKSNPDLTRRFIAATIKGYEYALNNVDETVTIFAKYQRDTPGPIVKDVLQLVKGLVYSEEAKASGIGYMDPKKIANQIDVLTDAMQLKKKVAPAEFYTSELLPKR